MFDDVYSLSYMMRYLFAALAVVIVWLIARKSVDSIRGDMVYRVKPIPGFWLISSMTSAGNGLHSSVRLPLYHTTYIGRASSCDIRIRRSDLAARHVMIYLYDGVWFLKPVGRFAPVYLNGVRIKPATPLESGDKIVTGNYEVVFVAATDPEVQHLLAQSAGDEYNWESYSEENGNVAVRGSLGPWILVNLFAAAASWLTYSLIPEGMIALQMMLPIAMIAVIILVDIYYLLLPFLLRGLDRYLFVLLLFLLAFGIVVQTRLSGMLSEGVLRASDMAASGDTEAMIQLAEFSDKIINGLKSQGVSIALGLLLLPLIVILVARSRILEPLSVLCAILTPALLAATLIFGHGSDQHGATLWISVGGMSLQLTEFAKITYIIVLASFFKIRPSKNIQLLFAFWAAIVFMLIMLLPDLGMVMILLPVTLVVYVVMTSEYLTALLIMVSGIAVSVSAYSFFPHVQRRLAGWTTLWQEVNDSNRQIVYGLQAVARGGLIGRGLGNGSPGGIPLVSSDMVFAIICEEFGMIGALTIVSLFIVIWLRSARVTVIAGDGFTSSLALAAGTMFFVEAAVVMAGVTGIIPLTGVTLPFISEGGSSLLAKILLMALLMGLSARRTGQPKLGRHSL